MAKLLKFLAICIATVLLATACSSGSGSDNGDKKGDSQSDDKDTVTYSDKMNKNVKIPKHPKRVIDMNFKNVGNLLLLGQKPVGVQEWIKWNPDLDKELKDTPKVDSKDVETIAKQKPDLILTTANDKSIKKYRKIAPTIVYDSQASYKDILKVQAKVLNKEDKGKEIIKNWDKKIEQDKKDLGSKIEGKTVSVIQDYQKEQTILGAGLGRSTEIVYDAYGMKPPKKVEQLFKDKGQKYFVLDREQLPDIDADYIDIVLFDKNSELFKLNEWKNLNAVKNDHVIKLTVADGSLADFKSLDNTRKKIKKQLQEMN